MNRTRAVMTGKLTAVAIGTLLVAAAIPWGVGRFAENWFVSRMEQLGGGAHALLRMRLVRYQRGWLASEAVTRVELGAPGDGFDLVHHIDHLPRLGEGWARVRSTPRWNGPAQARMAHYFGTNAPFSADTVIGFDGALALRLHSPAFSSTLADEPEVRLTWGGAQGDLHADADGRARIRLAMPGLALHGPGVVATFADLRVQGDWQGRPDPTAWSGTTQLSVSAVGLAGPEGGARLRRVEAGLERRDQGDTIALSGRVGIAEGTAVDAGAEEGFRDGAVAVQLDRLDKKALRTYLTRMAALPAALPEAQHTRANTRIALALLADLLEGGPRLRIEHARLTTPNGGFSVSGVLGVERAVSGASADDLLARLRLDLGAEVSAGLLEAWLARDIRPGVEAALLERGATDGALVRELTQRVVRERIADWTTAGILAVDRDRFVLRIALARGHLRVNGIPSDALLPAADALPSLPHGMSRGAHGAGIPLAPRVSGEIASVRERTP